MAKEEKFTFLSADGKTTIHAVRWIPEDGKYEAILQITHGMIEFVAVSYTHLTLPTKA